MYTSKVSRFLLKCKSALKIDVATKLYKSVKEHNKLFFFDTEQCKCFEYSRWSLLKMSRKFILLCKQCWKINVRYFL